jgi:hypothetical protein
MSMPELSEHPITDAVLKYMDTHRVKTQPVPIHYVQGFLENGKVSIS